MASAFNPSAFNSAFNLGDQSEILDLTAPPSGADGIVARWLRQSLAREPEAEDPEDSVDSEDPEDSGDPGGE